MDSQRLGTADIGVSTFYASCHEHDQCGSDGLPLTPNAVKIIGRFQTLTTIRHPRLCKYVHIKRGKRDRLMVVGENYEDCVHNHIGRHEYSDEKSLLVLMYKVLDGLRVLSANDICHRMLTPHTLLIDNQGEVKIGNFGLYHMTGYGQDVSFPVCSSKYSAPEVLASVALAVEEDAVHRCGPKSDVWSLGMIMLELALGGLLWSTLTLQQKLIKVLSFSSERVDIPTVVAREHNLLGKYEDFSLKFRTAISSCLKVSCTERSNATSLLELPLFDGLREICTVDVPPSCDIFGGSLRCEHLDVNSLGQENVERDVADPLLARSIDEVFYLWQLAGGDVEAELRKQGVVVSKPPITMLPNFVSKDGERFGETQHGLFQFDETVVSLSLDELRQRLKELDPAVFYPLLEGVENGAVAENGEEEREIESLPLYIRERDVGYQLRRVVLYDRLLKGYPSTRARIWKEARVDIPPFVRAYVWATLLDVVGDVQARYNLIDKETPTLTDRQIAVDIPRCHQYHELLSSPQGHAHFRRILKAWVSSNPQYVYWQGLDSLCAPFLYLNFNNEALAYACLTAFIPKYLNQFFLKDNSMVIQEYLTVFSHLISFHDAVLATHLDGIGFIPQLYAIPWFLTMFTHVFPLQKILHLWDTLLLGDNSLPLCIGVAILMQLRDRLLSFDFNECILLFSDMPEIDMEKCVEASIRLFCCTPRSAFYRKHAVRSNGKQAGDSSKKPSDMQMNSVDWEILKGEVCPRICGEELIELSGLRGRSSSIESNSTMSKVKAGKTKVLSVDVRSEEDYSKGCLPGSLNIPFATAFSPQGDLADCQAVTTLKANSGKVIAVMGCRGSDHPANFANQLVRAGFSKVCILHKGMDVFRSGGWLTVPPAQHLARVAAQS